MRMGTMTIAPDAKVRWEFQQNGRKSSGTDQLPADETKGLFDLLADWEAVQGDKSVIVDAPYHRIKYAGRELISDGHGEEDPRLRAARERLSALLEKLGTRTPATQP
jgi:hypothetical protein